MGIRIKEHFRYVSSNRAPDLYNIPSFFANHLISTRYSSDFNNAKLLHFCPKGVRFNVLEILEIKMLMNDSTRVCLNDQLNFSVSILDNLVSLH